MRSPCCSAVTSRLSLPPILCPTMPENTPSSATATRIRPSIALPCSAILPLPGDIDPGARARRARSARPRLKSGLAPADSDQRRSRPSSRGTASGKTMPRSSPSAAITSRAAGSVRFALHETVASARACAAPEAPRRSASPLASTRTRGRSSLPDTVARSAAAPRTGPPAGPPTRALAAVRSERSTATCAAISRSGRPTTASAVRRPSGSPSVSASSAIAPSSRSVARTWTGTLSPASAASSGGSSFADRGRPGQRQPGLAAEREREIGRHIRERARRGVEPAMPIRCRAVAGDRERERRPVVATEQPRQQHPARLARGEAQPQIRRRPALPNRKIELARARRRYGEDAARFRPRRRAIPHRPTSVAAIVLSQHRLGERDPVDREAVDRRRDRQARYPQPLGPRRRLGSPGEYRARGTCRAVPRSALGYAGGRRAAGRARGRDAHPRAPAKRRSASAAVIRFARISNGKLPASPLISIR